MRSRRGVADPGWRQRHVGLRARRFSGRRRFGLWRFGVWRFDFGAPAAGHRRHRLGRQRFVGRASIRRRSLPAAPCSTRSTTKTSRSTSTGSASSRRPKPSIYARPDGNDPYPAGTKVEVTAYVLVNDSRRRLDLTDLSADYSSYGNALATQDTFAGADLLTTDRATAPTSATQFPAGSSTWYLLPGKAVVFGNAWFHRGQRRAADAAVPLAERSGSSSAPT